MIRVLCGTLLLLTSITMAQQQRDPPYSQPPYSTPPTFPQDQGSDRSKPPDTQAQGPEAGTNPSEQTPAEISKKIQQKLDTEPLLENSDLNVAVDEHSVTLSGTVSSQRQREVALSILALYAGKREIVDQTKLRS
jgi:hypothetical protein